MIQRIQSVFLLLVTILMILAAFLPYWNGTVNGISITMDAFNTIQIKDNQTSTSGHLHIGIIAIIAAALALFTILKYQNRKLQMRLCMINMLIVSAVIGLFSLSIKQAKEVLQADIAGNFGMGFYFPLLSLILIMLANHFIKKDDQLVKSIDRIR